MILWMCRSQARSEAVDERAVDSLLAARLAAKLGRDFDTADAMRHELLDVHGVEVDDKARSWCVAAPPVAGRARWVREDDDDDREGDAAVRRAQHGDGADDDGRGIADLLADELNGEL